MNHSDLAKEMFEKKSFDEFNVDILVSILMECDDLYANAKTESYLTDAEYDFLYLFTKAQAPTNSYFLGVGSEPKKGKTKLPFTMGSLTQVQIGNIDEWVNKWNLSDESIIITDKLDGVSCLLIYQDYKFMNAYTRGDGFEGQLITDHINKTNIPQNINIKNLAVRAEVIISKPNFLKMQEITKTTNNTKYKNPRNAIAGILNRKDCCSQEVYDLIDVITYEIKE